MTRSSQPRRPCDRCGTPLTEASYGTRRGIPLSTCLICLQTQRDRTKLRNRPRSKAISTRRKHATRLGLTVRQLEHDYGWIPARMAGDIARAYDHACVDCHVQYIEMKEAAGLANITLDILDRTKPPHYGINTRWICKSCNQRKGTMTPERWADFCNDARLRQEHLASVAANPEEHGYLPFAVGS